MNCKLLNYSLISLIFLLSGIQLSAKVISGKIVDEDTDEAVASATIQIIGTTNGTYADANGNFKLPGINSGDKLKISSIGYRADTITIRDAANITIKLKPQSEELNEAVVIGEINVEEVIERAIERREENQNRIKTFSGELYSKVVIQMDGNVFASSDEGSFSVGGTVGDKVDESYKMLVLETFSDNFKDKEKNINKSVIKQRRQTANIPKNDNLLAISQFFNFYNDEIKLLNTTFTTPLSSDALDVYNYKLVDRSLHEGKFVYNIDFEPSGSLTPTFAGEMAILEGSYELIQIKVKPGNDFKIKFLENLEIEEKFKESENEIWYPSYLNTSAKADINILSGFMDIKADLDATSIYNNVKVNEELPDSIYNTTGRAVTVAPMADSTDLSYWEDNSFRTITEKEKKIYNEIDSLVKKKEDQEVEDSTFRFDFFPYASYNKVETFSLGASAEAVIFNRFSIEPKYYYSFGQKSHQAEIFLDYKLLDDLNIYAGYYLTNGMQTYNRDYHHLINAVSSVFFKYDYYDYYRKEGMEIGADFELFNIDFNVKYNNYLASNLANKTESGYLKLRENWRENRQIDDGRYENIYADLSYGFVSNFSPGSEFEYELNLHGSFGTDTDKESYKLAGGSIETQFPIFNTGYNPISFRLKLQGGLADNSTPKQYLYMMPTDLSIISKFDSFLSPIFGIYGGESYHSIHAKLNFSDYLWRAVGLPSINEKRGLGMALTFAAGKFQADKYDLYNGTDGSYYTEAGFDISRIPTFISDFVYLNFSFRWGFGNLGTGRYGWGFGISSPF